MTAKDIIDAILKKCGLVQNVVTDPFSTSNKEVTEVIDLLNDKLTSLTIDGDFTQLKRECQFSVYSDWVVNTSYCSGCSAKVGDNRYLAVSEGVSVTEPSHTSGIVADSSESEWVAAAEVVIGNYRLSNYKLYQAEGSGTTGTVAPSHTSGSASDGKISWAFVKNVIYWSYKESYEKYPLSEIAPDWRAFCPLTFVNLTNQNILTSLTDEQWSRKVALDVEVDSNFFMTRDSAIWLYPEYSAADIISFFYYSKYAVEDADGVRKEFFTASDDLSLLPEQLLIWGTVYEWLAQKGMQSANNALVKYEKLLQKYLAQNQEHQRIMLDGSSSVNSNNNIETGNWVI